MDCFVGIDVAKATLDLAREPGGEVWSVTNDGAGVQELVNRLAPLAPTLIVLEATGGFEAAVVAALASAGLLVVVVNPRCGTSRRPAGAWRRPTRSTRGS